MYLEALPISAADLGDTDMASGGKRESFGREPHIEHRSSDPDPVVPRSRTGLVIDQLLSRGPLLTTASSPDSLRNGGTEPWSAVSAVLGVTSPSILEGHLTWLVARAQPVDPVDHRDQQDRRDHPLSPRVLAEDQARILIRALDERNEDDAIARGLEQSWTAADVPDSDDDIIAYASDLTTVTTGQPDSSPFLGLARSAAVLAEEILADRGASVAQRRFG
jgi:hypothetical protein